MPRRVSVAFVVLAVSMGVLGSVPVGASHNADDHTSNMVYQGTSVPATQEFTQSDLAFWGNRAYAGNYGGFRIIDISDPRDIENPARVIANVSCPGPQNDVSVWDSDSNGTADLLFLSVDSPRYSATDSTACGAGGLPAPFTPEQNAAAWEGVRVFDISNEAAPVQIAAVPTDCGSHTHTLVPGAPGDNSVYLYVSSYPTGGRSEGIPADEAAVPPRAANTRNDGTQCLEPHNKISIIRVPLDAPQTADDALAAGAEGCTGQTTGKCYPNVKELTLPSRQNATTSLPSGSRTLHFRGCHDISVFVGIDRAAGACWREGLIWDTSDPWSPQYLRGMTNLDVDLLFHSATFSWDGKIIAFEDESGGGGESRCRLEEGLPDRQGAMHFYDRRLNSLGYFKIPRNIVGPCTAHNYNVIPNDNGRYVLASTWYMGGTSMIDFTATRFVSPPSGRPIGQELGYYVHHTTPNTSIENQDADSDVWSSYWYNGFVYANGGLVRGHGETATAPEDFERGLDVFTFNHPAAEGALALPFLNPQTQMDLIAQTYSIRSRVTIRHTFRPHVFKGAVTSGRGECIVGRRIAVKRVRAGADPVVARTTTNDRGRWRVAHVRGGSGRYYAVALGKQFSEGINTVACRQARSSSIGVRG